MSHRGISDKLIGTLVPKEGELKVLDIGHGYGQIGLLIRSIRVLSEPTFIWGNEIYEPYHKMQESLGIYDKQILGDCLDVELPEKFFNISIASHLIEHLDKNNGDLLIQKMENWTKNRIIIVTPKGNVPAEEKDGNKWNEHHSGWTIKDFEALGFRVYQCTRQIHSKAVSIFATLWFKILGKTWNNAILVAVKDLDKFS